MMMQARGRVVPVLLSGGTGSPLWPLSRETHPKQLLSFLDEKALPQQTAPRVADASLFRMVIANAQHRLAIDEQHRSNPNSARRTSGLFRSMCLPFALMLLFIRTWPL